MSNAEQLFFALYGGGATLAVIFFAVRILTARGLLSDTPSIVKVATVW